MHEQEWINTHECIENGQKRMDKKEMDKIE
jgi:hypothetical protein